MMKVGVISDTHGLLRQEVLEILRSCDCILHAGDINNQAFWRNWAELRRSMWFGETTTKNGPNTCPTT